MDRPRWSPLHAAYLVHRTALAEGIVAMPRRPALHGDNGARLNATTVLAKLNSHDAHRFLNCSVSTGFPFFELIPAGRGSPPRRARKNLSNAPGIGVLQSNFYRQ